MNRTVKQVLPPFHLHSSKTNWNVFHQVVKDQLKMNVCLKTQNDVFEAVEHFNQSIQKATWSSTASINIHRLLLIEGHKKYK